MNEDHQDWIDQNPSDHPANLEAPDFQTTLNGALPGNTAAEFGTAPGSAPESVIGDQNPDEVTTANGGPTSPRDAEASAEQTAAEFQRQVDDYAADHNDGEAA